MNLCRNYVTIPCRHIHTGFSVRAGDHQYHHLQSGDGEATSLCIQPVSLAALGEVCSLLHGSMVVMMVPIGSCCSSGSRKRHWQGDGYELLVRCSLLLMMMR